MALSSLSRLRHVHVHGMGRALVWCTSDRLCTALGVDLPMQAAQISSTAARRGAHDKPPSSNLLLSHYDALIQSAALKPDEQQLQVVQRLARLLHELTVYAQDVQRHRQSVETYMAHREARLHELEEQDIQEQQRLQQEQQHLQQGQQQASSWQWLKDMWSSEPLSGSTAASHAQQSPQALARAAAARREAKVLQELGPVPPPPKQPRGVYLYGSVGSGKSLLMDMFSEAVQQQAALDCHRRIHFNAAMLEMHARLHIIDSQRIAQQQEQQARAGAAGPHTGAVTEASSDVEHFEERAAQAAPHLDEAAGRDGDDKSCADSSSSSGDSSNSSSRSSSGDSSERTSDGLVARSFDPQIARQRQAKAAVLAIRRHLRQARLGRHDSTALAQANAVIVRAAARSLIRGSGRDPHTGWAGQQGHVAAVLCFDEMQVTDVFAAVALKGLFEALMAEGCTVVATSNRAPWDLPRHGLHEDMFSYFVQGIMDSCDVVELSSGIDYRRAMLQQGQVSTLMQPLEPAAAQQQAAGAAAAATNSVAAHGSGAEARASDRSCSMQQQQQTLDNQRAEHSHSYYFWPLGQSADMAMQRKWASLTASSSSGSGNSGNTSNGQPQVLHVMFGRTLHVQRASGGMAWFEFEELCDRPLGAADYIAVCNAFHTVLISGVPAMSLRIRDQARRFITLVDEAYNARVRLVLSAERPPDTLFAGTEHGDEPIIDLEMLQFESAVEGSRLRRNLMADGGVAPVAGSADAVRAAIASMGGLEEQFAFKRAVSRLFEMQHPRFLPRAALMAQGDAGAHSGYGSLSP